MKATRCLWPQPTGEEDTFTRLWQRAVHDASVSTNDRVIGIFIFSCFTLSEEVVAIRHTRRGGFLHLKHLRGMDRLAPFSLLIYGMAYSVSQSQSRMHTMLMC